MMNKMTDGGAACMDNVQQGLPSRKHATLRAWKEEG